MTLRRSGAYDAAAQAELLQSIPGINDPNLQAGDFTINAGTVGLVLINKATAAAITLAAPRSGADDFKQIEFTSLTAAAHVITATGLLKTGAAAVNTATFAAAIGATVTFMAYQGLWYVQAQVGITFA